MSKFLDDFMEKALAEGDKHELDALTWEVAKLDHSNGWRGYQCIAIKEYQGRVILVAKIDPTDVSLENISVLQFGGAQFGGEMPWWFEGQRNKRLIRAIMTLPDYYPKAMVLTDGMDLDEIHAAQELVNG